MYGFIEVTEDKNGYWQGVLTTIMASHLEAIIKEVFEREVNLYELFGTKEGEYLDVVAYATPFSHVGNRSERIDKFFAPKEHGGGSNFHYVLSVLVEAGCIPDGRLLLLF